MDDRGDGLRVRQDGHVLVLVMDRPEVRNAIDPPLALALDSAVAMLEADAGLWCGVLGASAPAFCSGADLKTIRDGRVDDLRTMHGFAGLTRRRRAKPLIAAVDGAALAGGFELVLACDMVVASTAASFGLPEVKRCLIAAGGGTARLPRRLPHNVAVECLVTGDPITAQRAYELGMVNRLCEPGQAITEAVALAKRVTANSPVAVGESLQALMDGAVPAEDAAISASEDAYRRVEASDDCAEGVRAFLEKRPPKWIGS